MLPALPPELLVQVIKFATHIDGELETRIYDPFVCPIQSEIHHNLQQNTPTRQTILLVSKLFYTESIKILYRSISLVSENQADRLNVALTRGHPKWFRLQNSDEKLSSATVRIDLIMSEFAVKRKFDVDRFYYLFPNLRLFIIHNRNKDFHPYSPLIRHNRIHVAEPTPNGECFPRFPKLQVFYKTAGVDLPHNVKASCFIASHASLTSCYQRTSSMGGTKPCIDDGHWGLTRTPVLPSVKHVLSTGWETWGHTIFPNLESLTLDFMIPWRTLEFVVRHAAKLTILDLSIVHTVHHDAHFNILERLPQLKTLILKLRSPCIPTCDGIPQFHPTLKNIFIVVGDQMENAGTNKWVSEEDMDSAVLEFSESFPSLEIVRFWNRYLYVNSIRSVNSWAEILARRGIILERGFDQFIEAHASPPPGLDYEHDLYYFEDEDDDDDDDDEDDE